MIPPRLRMAGVRKRFGAAVALDGVDLEVGRGEVHALLGENGAGKSTLMKVLSGAVAPDAGAMELDGVRFAPDGPHAARAQGVAMIYQELNLAPHLTVEQNLMLGRERRRAGFVRRGAMRREVMSALDLLEHPDLAPQTLVIDLPPAARQIVEIARALVGDARVIAMDEPTSSLAHDDAERLFAVVARLAARGTAVVYISHFLEEAQRVASRYTVLRDGVTVESGALAGKGAGALIERMVGRSLGEIFPRVPHERGEPVLALRSLRGDPLPRGVDLVLRRGEIYGIAGLVGAGRTETLRALFGLDAVAAGRIRVGGEEDGGAPPARRLAQGVGMLSEDRQREGLAARLSIADNATLSKLEPFARFGLVSRARQRETADALCTRLRVRSRGAAAPVAELSGGNQQKVALARLLHHDVDVLLLDEPTRGIDVGSKAEIYRLIGELAARGKAVLLVSSYLPELLGVCDRIGVMHRGRLLAEREAGEWTAEAILEVASRGDAA